MKVSFIHGGGYGMASFRYRALAPALALGAAINDPAADVLVFAKPASADLGLASQARNFGKVIVDFCDDHFEQPHYGSFAALADAITCPTVEMARLIKQKTGRTATVIPDCYEYEEVAPHCRGDSLVWFGHASNLESLRALGELKNLRVISNAKGCIPWSIETVKESLRTADIFVLPATKPYKSPNRALEAIRMGCFIAADSHPALADIPVWKSGAKAGIAWAIENPEQAREMTRAAQDYIRERYSPRTLAFAWRKLLASVSTSAAEKSAGRVGSTLTLSAAM